MNEYVKFLIEIVKEAEKISKKTFEVKQKGSESDLVTNLDVEIENFLISKMKEKYPGFDIVSEENNAKKQVTDNCFIIDPIDGTINFANGSPLWATQVAVRVNGKPVGAVINFPRLGEFFYADETGAYLNGNKIHANVVPLKNTLYAIDGNNNLPSLERMRKHSSGRRNFGGVCVSMAYVAAGRIHGGVFRSDKPWDYEPGLFLAEMAGAKTKSIKGFHAAAMNQEFLDILELETAKKVDASNIFVLHSLNGDTLSGFGLDIKEFFGAKDVDVFLPKFPIRAESSYQKFKAGLASYLENGKLSNNSVVVCHSIGNPYFIRFCNEFNFVPKAYIAVAPGAVYEYPSKRNDYIVEVKKQAYLTPEELEFVKKNIKNTILLFSDEDDGNTEKFTRFEKDTGAKAIHLDGYNHFDGYHKIYKVPELNKIIDELL